MSPNQQWLTILIAVLGTMFTRFVSFILFPSSKQAPRYILYLGSILPSAVMAMLVIYAYKDAILNLTTSPLTFPTLIATLLIIVIHLWRRNLLLSISLGTIVYMLLVQTLPL